ncbi:serine/threonine protein kinase [Ktedonospora formicarum]|uniref:non-specific serine/threonine protein kinase n=1 Tax=Ktedonospora formicarum TaxID=2778364 RepID=A0A8J3IAY8_9CHLR|nr:serine/threonine-protein kinase [Ktedonospora formicarum]GHO49297.1 hypothetical protein KSX_74600 [Ktedonospora formicarum]
MVGKSPNDIANQPVIDRYRLLHFIHQGETQSVYQAVDTHTTRHVALKLTRLAQVSRGRSERLQHFNRAMEEVAALDHSHILPLLDFGVMAPEQVNREHDFVYMVMPLVAERSLDVWLHENRRQSNAPNARLESTELLSFVRQAAQALQYAHERNVLHMGVKQTNFLIRPQSDSNSFPHLELSDFAITRFTSNSHEQGIIAPELMAGRPLAASDQYALAIIVYELLTGQAYTPARYHGQSLSALFDADVRASKMTPAASSVLQRALAPEAQSRFSSVAEFADAFTRALDQGKRGENQYIMLGLSAAEAQSGTTFPLTLAGNRQVNITVPPNSQPGQIIQIDGLGKPSTSNGPNGALVVTLAIRPNANGVVSSDPGERQAMLSELRNISHQIQTLQSQAPATPSANPTASGSAPAPGQPLNTSSLEEQVQKLEHISRVLRTYDDYVKIEGPKDIPRFIVKHLPPGTAIMLVLLAVLIVACNCSISNTLQEAIVNNGNANVELLAWGNTQMTATAQASINSTATAKKNAQATAVAKHMQDVQQAIDAVHIPAQYNVDESSNNNEDSLIFTDLLNKSNTGQWKQGEPDAIPSCYFGQNDNFYHAKTNQVKQPLWCQASNETANLQRGVNFVLQVQLSILNGSTGGIVFGAGDVKSSCYFYISQTGDYEIGYNNTPFTHGKGKSTAINTGIGTNVTNLIAMVVTDKKVTFFINLEPVLSIEEVSLPTVGNVALVALSDGSPTDVAYQKIKAWQ